MKPGWLSDPDLTFSLHYLTHTQIYLLYYLHTHARCVITVSTIEMHSTAPFSLMSDGAASRITGCKWNIPGEVDP